MQSGRLQYDRRPVSGAGLGALDLRRLGNYIRDIRLQDCPEAEDVDGWHWLLVNIELSAWIDAGAVRQAGWHYSIEPVREALVNAVAHRDYDISVIDIELFIYSDRLEVISPGRLPNTVTVEKMRAGYRAFRNELIKAMSVRLIPWQRSRPDQQPTSHAGATTSAPRSATALSRSCTSASMITTPLLSQKRRSFSVGSGMSA